MFLIFGTTLTETIVNVVAFVCGICGRDAPQQVIKRSNRLSLFFIPLFALSSHYINRCTNCGGETALSAAQVQHSLSWKATR